MQRVILRSWFRVLVGQWQLNNMVTLHAGWTQHTAKSEHYTRRTWHTVNTLQCCLKFPHFAFIAHAAHFVDNEYCSSNRYSDIEIFGHSAHFACVKFCTVCSFHTLNTLHMSAKSVTTFCTKCDRCVLGGTLNTRHTFHRVHESVVTLCANMCRV